MKPLLFFIYGSKILFHHLLNKLNCDEGKLTIHVFPDEETSIVVESNVKDRDVIFFATLDRPNAKILPLIFSSCTVKSLGAKSIHLIAPYLAYMREDKQFVSGGSITSHYFSALLSKHFSSLTTMDPHLHRIHHLHEIYSIPTTTLHATSCIANWIHDNIQHPLLIGPDEESEQWTKSVANKINAPFVLLNKKRKSDQEISVQLPSLIEYYNRTPVLLDDIISSGHTMLEPVKQLRQLPIAPPICIGVHAIFAENAYENLLDAGAEKVVTSNAVEHVSNEIDISETFFSPLSNAHQK